MSTKKQKIGISLSGGSAMGYAHLGLLQAVEEAGYKPDCVVGTSMGAIMGMMYAAGYKPLEIKKIIKDEKMDSAIRIAFPNVPKPGGFVSTIRIQRILKKYVPDNSFDKLQTKFYCCTSNMETLQAEYHGQGDNLVEYVMASAAMPGVFSPVKVNGVNLVDGGIHDHLPVKPLLDEKCDIRIGSNLLVEKPGKKKLSQLWIHAFLYCSFSNYHLTAGQFTDLINIDPGKYWLSDFKAVNELFEIGYNTGKTYFKNSKSKIQNPK